jgi:hypothetical protein
MLSGAVRFGGAFVDLMPEIGIDSNNTMIEAISSSAAQSEQLLLLQKFHKNPKRLNILRRLVYLGHYKVVWTFLKENALYHYSKYDMLLELAVIQFQEPYLKEEAKQWNRMSIRRGLERLDAFEKLRASIIKRFATSESSY